MGADQNCVTVVVGPVVAPTVLQQVEAMLGAGRGAEVGRRCALRRERLVVVGHPVDGGPVGADARHLELLERIRLLGATPGA